MLTVCSCARDRIPLIPLGNQTENYRDEKCDDSVRIELLTKHEHQVEFEPATGAPILS